MNFKTCIIINTFTAVQLHSQCRIDMCQVVDKGETTVDDHGAKLDSDNESIHCQEENLEGLCGKVEFLELRELKCVEQDDPHHVD